MVLFFLAALGNEYNAQILLSLPWKAETKKNIVCAMCPLLFFLCETQVFISPETQDQ